MEKQCTKCGEIKALDEFYTGRARCKACLLSQQRAYRQTEAGKAAGKRYAQSEKGKDKFKRYRQTEKGKAVNARRHAKYPEKRKARWKVSKAIKTGKLTRQPCEICGNEKSEAHHEDYSKPLDVIWLCAAHHVQRHQQMEAA